ncbi:MAG: type III pantothenate kinase [Candidatus Rokubacteria bacterium]|nr:type III pantothenate kinase [Candidatus Rokubacteria bacterium]
MLLVIDVGNTNMKVGLCDDAGVRVSWTLTTRREQTADEYGLFLEAFLRSGGVEASQVTAVAISNVVPPVQQALDWMAEKYFKVTPLTITGANSPLPLDVDEPREVGPDRIVSCVAARAIYGAPVIVVDLGTATRFDCVNARGAFVGGAIAPGLGVGMDALVNRAARLFRVEMVRPETAIGRNTITNIQSGMIFGFAGLVDGVVERMKEELGGAPTVVGTGGHAPLVAGASRTIQHVNAELKLEGLRLAWVRSQREPRA